MNTAHKNTRNTGPTFQAFKEDVTDFVVGALPTLLVCAGILTIILAPLVLLLNSVKDS